MKVGGTDLISPQTQAAATRLLTISFATSFVHFFGVELSELTILGVQLSGTFFFKLMLFIIVFQIVSLLFHWFSDYVTYTRWFEKNIAEVERWGDPLAHRRSHQEEIYNIIDELSRTWETYKVEEKKKLNPKVSDMFSELYNLQSLLEKCGRNASNISIYAKMQVYGWYLCIPCLFGSLGLVVSAVRSFDS